MDINKVFDNVDWKIIIEIFKMYKVNFRDWRIVKELYNCQKALIQTDDCAREAGIFKCLSKTGLQFVASSV